MTSLLGYLCWVFPLVLVYRPAMAQDSVCRDPTTNKLANLLRVFEEANSAGGHALDLVVLLDRSGSVTQAVENEARESVVQMLTYLVTSGLLYVRPALATVSVRTFGKSANIDQH